MVPENIAEILNDLNLLLAEDLSPRSISGRFENIAGAISREKIHIEKTDCKEYYADGDLELILLMKNEALANGQFEQASKFRLLEVELLLEKGDNELTRLKMEPGFFEYKNEGIIFHCNKEIENQRLIANLIEGYNIANKKLNTAKMINC